jgi:Flp pilus assembly protein TadG
VGLRGDAGSVTVEAALAVAALVAVLVLCIAGITAVSMQVRCIDAAREAARLVARGDDDQAEAAARRIAPPGAALHMRRDGQFIVARVSAGSVLLPGVTIAAEVVSAAEPSGQ